jgi:hypothetical protein
MAARLKVYAPTEEEGQGRVPSRVPVRLAELLPLVALAYKKNYLWLQDFLDDEVTVTEDLYEVMHAFRCTRPSA